MKTCINCLLSKDYSEFYKDKSKPDGYYHQCKSCKNSRRKIVEKIKRNIDPFFKFKHNLNKRLNNSLLRNKDNYIFKSFPYSKEELKKHLEKMFEPWMNWNNIGTYNSVNWNDYDSSTWTWQIDHIIPQSKYPYKSFDDKNFLIIWSLDNLRPLNSKFNLIKGKKYS